MTVADDGALPPAWLRGLLLWLALAVATALAGCSSSNGANLGGVGGGSEINTGAGGAGGDPFDGTTRCSSNMSWDVNFAEGEDMAPGRACIACHAESNAATGEEAPIFAFAGTIYPTAREPDYCISTTVAGAVVEITDANGVVLTAEANASGNFFEETSRIAFPFKARVLFEGRTREMLTPQTTSDCNGCHTQTGANGAPGRIVLP